MDGRGPRRRAQVAYDTPGDDAVEEWVEIYNPTSAAIDLTGWKLKDGSGSFAFPAATQVAPGKHLIVARNGTGFTAWFGFAPHVAGMSLALGNSGDSLRLVDAAAHEVDFVAWEATATGWPVSATTGGAIRRGMLDADTNSVADWTVSTPARPRGTP